MFCIYVFTYRDTVIVRFSNTLSGRDVIAFEDKSLKKISCDKCTNKPDFP